MAPIRDAPCTPWEPIWCGMPVTGAPVQAASEILWAMTGRQFGLCQVTIRPCRRDCADLGAGLGGPLGPWGLWDGGTPVPALIGGRWFNLTCAGCAGGAGGGGGCSCAAVSEALLPAPVAEVLEVKVDGAVLDPSAYRVDNYRLLVRVDGGTWPLCNNFAAADTEAGTWSVTVSVGVPVPVSGQLAVGELAAEIARACAGEDCRLPKQVAQLVRQGVTVTMPDPAEVTDHGLLGLTLCDRFIAAYNPHRLQSRAEVYNVDLPRWRTAGT